MSFLLEKKSSPISGLLVRRRSRESTTNFGSRKNPSTNTIMWSIIPRISQRLAECKWFKTAKSQKTASYIGQLYIVTSFWTEYKDTLSTGCGRSWTNVPATLVGRPVKSQRSLYLRPLINIWRSTWDSLILCSTTLSRSFTTMRSSALSSLWLSVCITSPSSPGRGPSCSDTHWETVSPVLHLALDRFSGTVRFDEFFK